MILNFKEALISQDFSIRAAMRAIDKVSLRTVFILNESDQLVGSVSDGDIRRGLLQDLNMEDAVSCVMNKGFFSLNEFSTKSERTKILNDNDLQCLPIISADHRICDIVTLKSLAEYERRENIVFIMAGGFGTRLRPLTDNCPKPMLSVGSKPMLEHLVDRLSKQGFYKFYFSTHYLPDVIKSHFSDGLDWGVEIKYVHEDAPLGTGGALSLLPHNLPNLPMIVLNGDVLTDLDFTVMLDFHSSKAVDATMCVREVEHQISYGVVESIDNKVVGMREKPTFVHDINTGVYILNQDIVKSLSVPTRIDMPTHLQNCIEVGKKVGSMKHSGYWIDIGRISDFQKAQVDIENIFS
mgnify:CR=1 FL=1